MTKKEKILTKTIEMMAREAVEALYCAGCYSENQWMAVTSDARYYATLAGLPLTGKMDADTAYATFDNAVINYIKTMMEIAEKEMENDNHKSQ
ncbi:MAG: hypothetical protein GF364_04995 [Candidatus Lokiarchaeota archaeon]|nr:hypothetical protein [Candidatus Lokiarchaeota archaeon]